nr:MAG TPA: hypothetical protein [Caudoviricetes sp.]
MLMQSVFPDLTAPSQIMPFLSLHGLPLHHQVSAASCFSEKGTKSFNGIVSPQLAHAFCAFLKGLVKAERLARSSAVQFGKLFKSFYSVEKLYFHSAALRSLDFADIVKIKLTEPGKHITLLCKKKKHRILYISESKAL